MRTNYPHIAAVPARVAAFNQPGFAALHVDLLVKSAQRQLWTHIQALQYAQFPRCQHTTSAAHERQVSGH
jgi:hypothetical protein